MSTITPPFGITVCGLDELDGYGALNATHVLSILDPDDPVPEAFGQYGAHERLELRFDDIIDETPGKILPTPEHVAAILAFGRSFAAEPNATLIVHCHAGISRSTAAMTLILAQAMPEAPGEAILATVHGIREKTWPNLRIIELGDAMLGREGTLIQAAYGIYRLQVERRPHLIQYMDNSGRAREFAAASAYWTKPAGSPA